MAIKKLGLLKESKRTVVPEVVRFDGLTLEPHGNCCGAKILGGFDSGRKTRDPENGITLDEFFIGGNGVEDQVDYDSAIPSGGELIVATTIPSQTLTISELRRVGFAEMASWKNPNSSNVVTLWGRLY